MFQNKFKCRGSTRASTQSALCLKEGLGFFNLSNFFYKKWKSLRIRHSQRNSLGGLCTWPCCIKIVSKSYHRFHRLKHSLRKLCHCLCLSAWSEMHFGQKVSMIVFCQCTSKTIFLKNFSKAQFRTRSQKILSWLFHLFFLKKTPLHPDIHSLISYAFDTTKAWNSCTLMVLTKPIRMIAYFIWKWSCLTNLCLWSSLNHQWHTSINKTKN